MNDTMWPPMGAGARLSECGLFRYELTRRWAKGPCVAFVMLNPSTADATRDDPTIRVCRSFAQRWDMGALVVVNLFAYRATKPSELKEAQGTGITITGGWDGDLAVHDACTRSRLIVAAWGARPQYRDRAYEITQWMLPHRTFYCLGTTKGGYPRHPLRVPLNTQPQALVTI